MFRDILGERLVLTSLGYFQPEEKSAALKEINFDEPQLVDTDITPTQGDLKNPFSSGSIVFVEKKDCYAKVVAFDKDKQEYTLKIRQSEGELKKEDNNAECTTLMEDVAQRVRVKIHQTISLGDENHFAKYRSCLRSIDIHEPIMSQLNTVSKSFLHKGVIINNEINAETLQLCQDQSLLALGAGAPRIVPTDWKRYKNYQLESDTSASKNYYDCVGFKSRGDVLICGFMWSKEYNAKDFTLMVSWCIDNEPFSEDVEFSVAGEEGLGEDKVYRFNFQDYGIEPVSVGEGEVFHIRAKNPTENRFCYIYSGYPNSYHHIEGQENMFWTIYSQHNQNCTDGDWGFFPGILYHGGTVNEEINQDNDCYEEEE